VATNSRTMAGLSPDDVHAVLADGWTYEHWVVGTRMIRAVDPTWPAPGSRLHYTVGRWPLRKDDETVVLERVDRQTLVLQAKAWPAGSARIVITTSAEAAGVRVEIEEHPDQGVAARLHNPLLDLAIKVRNVETLRRLEQVARRSAPTAGQALA
jgi:hypothetical protein